MDMQFTALCQPQPHFGQKVIEEACTGFVGMAQKNTAVATVLFAGTQYCIFKGGVCLCSMASCVTGHGAAQGHTRLVGEQPAEESHGDVVWQCAAWQTSETQTCKGDAKDGV
mmetsp:Transcript_17654/g.34010  ORF Transcript_17654/g.34010 Transcript_17654/m.34010 type:complete len:112 (+) Transcript_17654:46-381(+)